MSEGEPALAGPDNGAVLDEEQRTSLSIPSRWVRQPVLGAGDEACLFVLFAPGGRLPEHSLIHARAWAAAGFKLVVIVVVDSLSDFAAGDELAFADGVLVRLNRGYDFGAWAAVINGVPALRHVGLLAIVNDSVYGPFDGFTAMLDRVRAIEADVIGITESHQRRRHFQSFLMFFRPAALESPAFRRFWRRVLTLPKKEVIRLYELRLLDKLERGGLRCMALYPIGTTCELNPSLAGWRDLMDSGFPFLKVKLVRDGPRRRNIEGWADAIRSRGYDPAIVTRHLGLPEMQATPMPATEPMTVPYVSQPASDRRRWPRLIARIFRTGG